MIEYSEKIIKSFYQDCSELVDNLEKEAIILNKEPGNKDSIKEIFRLLHSIKSEAGLMNFLNLSNLAHRAEDLFQSIHHFPVSEEIRNLLFDIIGKLKDGLEQVLRTGTDSIEIAPLINRITRYIKPATEKKETKAHTITEVGKLSVDKVLRELKNYKYFYKIEVSLDPTSQLKFVRAFLIYNTLTELGKIIKSSVPFREGLPDELFINFYFFFLTNHPKEEIKKAIDVADVESIKIVPVKLKEKKKRPSKEEKPVSFIKIESSKIDKIINSVGELIVNYNRLETLTGKLKGELVSDALLNQIDETLEAFKKSLNVLQEEAITIRMVPVKELYEKIELLVYKLVRETGKKVKIEFEGEDTELDNNVMEKIRESIFHIIRNAVDHGIEMPAERKQKGKKETGLIKVKAYQSGNHIIIEIADDGRGLDIEKIKRKAIEKGLISSAEAEQLGKEKVIEFIFHQGFSTADKTTEISGRGIGMDVVKQNIRELGGNIEIQTEKDKGTTITISLPITLVILKALIVKSSGLYFAIPLNFVEEIVRAFPSEIEKLENWNIIKRHGEPVIIIELSELLDLNREIPQRKKYFIVIVNIKNEKAGIIVDELFDEEDIVIKPIEETGLNTRGISGGTILGDGNIAYVIDPSVLILEEYFKSSVPV